ncbi:hypothetical protein AA0117_g8513 [Alternaria alternata]|uniref:GPI anchored protein n=1 Tax=Alternaria alternata TaxID=5599 RepID=A0A4Q4NBD3_ALTAL|nr:hypothetical protein AA0118_g8258 [Alternaria tenuissima]RYN72533.1 hypothetical protein AA0117_g8513 [Alternaria alternata]
MSIFRNLLAATAIVNVAFAGIAYSSDVASVVTSVQLVTSVTFADPPAASSSTHCNTLTVTEVAPPSTVTVVAPPPGASGTDILESSKSDGMTIQTSIPSSTISKVQPTETCVSSLHTVAHGGKAFTITACHLPPAGLISSTGTVTLSETEVIPVPSASATIDTSLVHATANFTGTAITGSIISPSFSRTNTYSHTFHMNGTKTATATGTGGASASASYTAPSLPPFTDAADATNVGAAVLFGGVLMALFGA